MHRWGDGTMDLYHQILLPCRMYVRPNIHFLVVQNISTSTSTSAYSLFSFLFNLNLYLYPPHEHCSNTSQYVSFGPINSINSINSINPNKAHNLTVRLPHLPPPLAEFGPDHPSPITHHPLPTTSPHQYYTLITPPSPSNYQFTKKRTNKTAVPALYMYSIHESASRCNNNHHAPGLLRHSGRLPTLP